MPDFLWQLDDVTLGMAPPPRLGGVTLAVEQGVTAVLGRSGAGKTSLLNLLVGFESPDAGRIQKSLVLQPDHAGSLFWSPGDGGLWPRMSVRDHLTAVSPGDDPAVVDRMLAAFDLTALAAALPHRLSQGERSRLTVARALASGAAVLVMDEPLAHVDPARLGGFWSVIRHHVQAAGCSLIFSTHHADTVLAQAARVVCLDAGGVVYSGGVDALYRHPPTLEAARCLGEVNWLPRDEASLWCAAGSLPQPDARHPIPDTRFLSLRPEHLDIVPDPASPIIVQSCRFRGTISDVQLHHTHHQLTRAFVHRSSIRPLVPGDRVSLRVLLLLMLCGLLAGCGRGGDPVLDVKEFRFQMIPADEATLPTPRAVALGSGDEVIILDKAGRVLVFDGDNHLLRQWWMPEYSRGKPEGACLLQDGRIAIADTHYSRVVMFDNQGRVLGMFGSEGRGPGQFIYPVKVIQDDKGFLYVLEYGGNDRIQKFTPDGVFLLSIGSSGDAPGGFSRPGGIVWHEGKLYVADADNHRVQAFHDDGRFIGVLTDEGRPLALDFPYDLAMGPDGFLYVIEYGAGRLSVITTQGKLIGRYGSAGRGNGQFATPWGVRVDRKKQVWIADTGNRRVVELKL